MAPAAMMPSLPGLPSITGMGGCRARREAARGRALKFACFPRASIGSRTRGRTNHCSDCNTPGKNPRDSPLRLQLVVDSTAPGWCTYSANRIDDDPQCGGAGNPATYDGEAPACEISYRFRAGSFFYLTPDFARGVRSQAGVRQSLPAACAISNSSVPAMDTVVLHGAADFVINHATSVTYLRCKWHAECLYQARWTFPVQPPPSNNAVVAASCMPLPVLSWWCW